MKKSNQIIVRMSNEQKQTLQNLLDDKGGTISKLVRDLLAEYIRQQNQKKII